MVSSVGYHSVPIDRIVVPDRIRKDYRDLDGLQGSISRLILLGPIVTTRDNVLVAGGRRFYACKALGHTSIDCHFIDDVDEFTLKEIELEENIKRKELSWQEERRWVAEYHNLQRTRDPEWDQGHTAKRIGVVQTWVSDRLIVHTEIERGNTELLDIPVFSTALGVATRNRQRRKHAPLRGFDSGEKPERIICADFCEWATKTYDGPKFNFLHCDFPFGIDTDKRQQGDAVAVHSGYDDSPKTYRHLLKVLCANLDNFCAESAHIMFWFSMHNYCETLEFFRKNSDFEIDPFPLIWTKSDNKGLNPDPDRGPRRIYETCLFGSRGDLPIRRSVSNAFAAPTDRSADHLTPKPEPVLRNFFRMFVDENTVMLDPTCGSGNALLAAKSLNAAHVQGIEINEEFVERANLALEKSGMFT
jgi:hypothetical protein